MFIHHHLTRLLRLSILAAIGMLPAAPLQAEEAATPPTAIEGPLAEINFQELGGGVRYGKIDGRSVYFIEGGTPGVPSCVILCSHGSAQEDKAAFKRVTRRFIAAFKLEQYLLYTAKDGSMACLVRDAVRKRQELGQGECHQALQETRVMPIFEWLSCATGGTPSRIEGTRLIWSKSIRRRGKRDAVIDISLDLLSGNPGLLSIHTMGDVDIVAELNRLLQLGLKVPAKSKLAQLKRQLAATPVASSAATAEKHAKHSAGDLCLVSEGEVQYLLGTFDNLRHQRGKKASPRELPAVESAPWPGARATASQPAAAATPAATTPAQRPAEQANATARSGQPTLNPAEARALYAELLRAL